MMLCCFFQQQQQQQQQGPLLTRRMRYHCLQLQGQVVWSVLHGMRLQRAWVTVTVRHFPAVTATTRRA